MWFSQAFFQTEILLFNAAKFTLLPATAELQSKDSNLATFLEKKYRFVPHLSLPNRAFLYNGNEGMWTSLNLNVFFQRDGTLLIKYYLSTFQSDPYSNGLKVILDYLFAVLIGRMLYAEGSEIGR